MSRRHQADHEKSPAAQIIEFMTREDRDWDDQIERDHVRAMEVLDMGMGHIRDAAAREGNARDLVNCVAILATGPATRRGDAGPVRITLRTCCRWHGYSLLGALDDAKRAIMAQWDDEED